MKGLYKFLIVLAVIMAFIFGAWFLIRRSIGNNLDTKYQTVEQQWTLLFDESAKRINIIKRIIALDPYRLNELSFAVEKNLNGRELFAEKCTIDFVKLEFDVNEILLDAMDISPTVNGIEPLLDELAANKVILNKYVTQYNAAVSDFNNYYSLFPNFIIAKQKGYVRQKFFEIIYGERNTDPLIKYRRQQHWIETGEWKD